jgi:hypothetical protein
MARFSTVELTACDDGAASHAKGMPVLIVDGFSALG